MIEISISVKDDSSRLVERQIFYHPLILDIDNPVIKEMVERVMHNFTPCSEEAPEIIFRAKLVIQS